MKVKSAACPIRPKWSMARAARPPPAFSTVARCPAQIAFLATPRPAATKACYIVKRGGGDDYGDNDDDNYGDDDYGQGRGRWVACAREGQYCDFRGRKLVRYGVRGRFTQDVFRNGVDCTRRLWRDPAARKKPATSSSKRWRERRVRPVVAAPAHRSYAADYADVKGRLKPPTGGMPGEWWAMTGSNRRHLRCKRSALPTELIARSGRGPLSGRDRLRKAK